MKKMKLFNQRNIILRKQEILENARSMLKREFIGIDAAIDQVVDLSSAWYLMPHLQDRPVIVNLWGLTGVGKSSLVNRFVELILFQEKHYRFDLGDEDRFWTIKDQLTEIYSNDNGYPVVISLDEFQHFNNRDESSNSNTNNKNGIIWELLDSGKFTTVRQNRFIEDMYGLYYKLKYALVNGVIVSKGKVLNGKKKFKEIIKTRELEFDELELSEQEPLAFVSEKHCIDLYDIAQEKFDSPFDIKNKLDQLNGQQTVEFFHEILSFAISPKLIDCSKSIIFVIGNLDKAYYMSNNYNPDICPNEFHKQSLKINISDIKLALRDQLRNEQIARLGNNHVIYPALNRSTFRKLIDKEVVKIKAKIYSECGLKLIIDESVRNLIFDEGVFPNQGTRPVFSTVYQLIGSKIGTFTTKIFTEELSVDSIELSRNGNLMLVSYTKDGKEQYNYSEKLVLRLTKLRKNTKDDKQAIAAVHESGHAVLSIILLNTLPEAIFSATADGTSEGFVFTNYVWKYISKNQILLRAACYLGGLEAEKIVFGDNHITNGAENDIQEATTLLSSMLKESGMGEIPGHFQVPTEGTNYSIFDPNNQINQTLGKLLKEASILANKALQKEKKLLIYMSNYLSDNISLKKDEIRQMVDQHSTYYNTKNLIEKGDHLYYRKKLKEEYEMLSSLNYMDETKSILVLNKIK